MPLGVKSEDVFIHLVSTTYSKYPCMGGQPITMEQNIKCKHPCPCHDLNP